MRNRQSHVLREPAAEACVLSMPLNFRRSIDINSCRAREANSVCNLWHCHAIFNIQALLKILQAVPEAFCQSFGRL